DGRREGDPGTGRGGAAAPPRGRRRRGRGPARPGVAGGGDRGRGARARRRGLSRRAPAPLRGGPGPARGAEALRVRERAAQERGRQGPAAAARVGLGAGARGRWTLVAPTAGSTPPRATGGHYEAAYRTVAVDGDVAVANGIKRYGGRPGGPVVRKCRSCFVIRFDAEGRCRSFTEWYIALAIVPLAPTGEPLESPPMSRDGIFYDADANLDALRGRTIAILGYGSQGHAHALNLRDSGFDVLVGLRPESPSRAEAEAEGLEVLGVADAASRGDVVMILLPDEKQAEVWEAEIRD